MASAFAKTFVDILLLVPVLIVLAGAYALSMYLASRYAKRRKITAQHYGDLSAVIFLIFNSMFLYAIHISRLSNMFTAWGFVACIPIALGFASIIKLLNMSYVKNNHKYL